MKHTNVFISASAGDWRAGMRLWLSCVFPSPELASNASIKKNIIIITMQDLPGIDTEPHDVM